MHPEGFARSGHSSRSCGGRDGDGERHEEGFAGVGMRDICYLLVARLSDPGFSYVQYSTVLRGLLHDDTVWRGADFLARMSGVRR